MQVITQGSNKILLDRIGPTGLVMHVLKDPQVTRQTKKGNSFSETTQGIKGNQWCN